MSINGQSAPGVTVNDSMNASIEVTLAKVSGDDQTLDAGLQLVPFIVKTKYKNNQRISGVRLDISVIKQPTGGNARLSATNITTDTNGEASVVLTLGDVAGEYQVEVKNAKKRKTFCQTY